MLSNEIANLLWFLGGTFVGSIIGIIIMCLLLAGKEDNR